MELLTGYVVDACTIIDLARRKFPQHIFEAVHAKIEELIKQGLLVSPQEVYNELARQRAEVDPTLDWADAHKPIFKDITESQDACLAKIMGDFPNFVKVHSEDFDADPIIVALAMDRGWKVVTEETRSKTPQKVKIPDVCSHYDIPCMNMFEFFEDNGWKF